MKRTGSTYSTLLRSAWLIMTVFLVVFTGPVKRVIELRIDHIAANVPAADAHAHIKKLRTWYREKRETAPLISFSSQHSHDDGVILFLVSSFLTLLLLSAKGVSLKPQADALVSTERVPLYLRCRRLLV